MTTNLLARIEEACTYLGQYTAGQKPDFAKVNECLLIVQNDLPLLKELVEAASKMADDDRGRIIPGTVSLHSIRCVCEAVRALQERQA